MNRYFLIVAALVVGLCFQACNARKTTDEQGTNSTTATASTAEPAADVSVTGRLADLGLTSDSHWRGINLGDAFSNVKSTEKGEPFESDENHIGYTVEFKNLESADMLYYQKNQNVSAINVDLFLNNQQSVDGYKKELEPYFTARYGTAKAVNGSSVWTGPKGETITLKDVSKGKDFGLKIRIAQGEGAITASTK
ncbi:hypothetical protein M0L20_16705 [Spirosoma sp. RP8]|uniref:Lipoprotein n=1 Tax=Spirosoma liriopis TaxID=2937440 RepID=A0ABT0HMW1_9BACT|nr:hypothetical protein [Spirosoma liriopis]MCK8493511.1 hypothetical protein [Spirosoma liriopis]